MEFLTVSAFDEWKNFVTVEDLGLRSFTDPPFLERIITQSV